MICSHPFLKGPEEYPCGRCGPCRINRRNIWSTRLILENTCHDESCWLTLTYDDEHLPKDHSLTREHYQRFIKSIRKQIYPKKIRYYVCGEYGDYTSRPHYHMVLFGLSFPFTGLADAKKVEQLNYYDPKVIKLIKAWGQGNIHIGVVNNDSMSYNCGHITKSLGGDWKTEENIVGDRMPPFHAMSQGIGKDALPVIQSWLTTAEGSKHLLETNDVPTVVRIEGKLRPIGKYLRNLIRLEAGMEPKQPEIVKIKRQFEHNSKIKKYGYDYLQNKRKADCVKAKQRLQRGYYGRTL